MNIRLITDHERELLARIEMLKLALLTIQARANSTQLVGLTHDVHCLSEAALRYTQ